ncbi:MAG TPA: hypothetical protein VHE55_12030 [Fimbriimonadaceae bacterium]|nr:hypothetical protein [Fimbriimonadaceae bacterium]
MSTTKDGGAECALMLIPGQSTSAAFAIADGAVELRAEVSRRLTARLLDGAGTELSAYTSDPVLPEGHGMIAVGASWEDGQIYGVFVNGINLKLLQGEPPRFEFILEQRPCSAVLSVERPESAAACAPWISQRANKFKSPKTQAHRTLLKSNDEQAQDLRRSLNVLRHLAASVIDGKRDLLGPLVAELRALYFWKSGASHDGYNPLLLRMASKADLPLAVYAIPKQDMGMPPNSDFAEFLVLTHIPHVPSLFAQDEIIDIQEWLTRPVVRIGQAPGRWMDFKTIIGELAHTVGTGHYSEDKSEFILELGTMRVDDLALLAIMFAEFCLPTITLGEWVLTELEVRGVIGQP